MKAVKMVQGFQIGFSRWQKLIDKAFLAGWLDIGQVRPANSHNSAVSLTIF